MSTTHPPGIEATMPATTDTDSAGFTPLRPYGHTDSGLNHTPLGDYLRSHPTTLGDVVRAAGPLGGSEKAAEVLQSRSEPPAETANRLIQANQRAAWLAEQLAETTAKLDAAEHRAADLEDRNRELASDLDNALDQLQGHALHAEQERLFHASRYSVNAFTNLDAGAEWER
ncbi:hypothetical protein [Nocardia sp. NPDC050435]|uniref:hypothetical protein n=1 Tax=Nocardia sp. NPDC050435 TaxID=3155040 RepID=UPI0033C4D164